MKIKFLIQILENFVIYILNRLKKISQSRCHRGIRCPEGKIKVSYVSCCCGGGGEGGGGGGGGVVVEYSSSQLIIFCMGDFKFLNKTKELCSVINIYI